MGHEYSDKIVTLLKQHQNSENREAMEAYMRNQFQFFGIRTPERTALLRDFLKEHGKPQVEELPDIVRCLWSEPQRECQYIALSLLDKQSRYLTKDHLPFLEEIITDKSWWDTIDHIAPNHVGKIYQTEEDDAYLEKWIHSDNMWLNRISILHQLKYKGKTDQDRLFRYILFHNESKEFFIQKAIGWALREYSKTDPEAVQQFIESEKLAPLSKREGMKHINRRAKEGKTVEKY
ncbi:DNA alkylation repair protein [Rossellomorea aquimaris]|uniref:DNA alkylation repair protein n=1 Tax=Rossellomorea aquimaris TaxID=189382 RepID=A0A5D4TPL5_9BACI|nr:DNA alkylation repair protein [Rossellomorea aquimaris]TYS76194.1 DNA alkylation repair protein [Rossellomorea aquimaris]TYS82629.1 DNA alkylation repair protein [Rossellomorea aquimaris]